MSMFRGPWWIIKETVASLLFGAHLALKLKFGGTFRSAKRTMKRIRCALGLHQASDAGFQLYEYNPPTYRCKHCGDLFE